MSEVRHDRKYTSANIEENAPVARVASPCMIELMAYMAMPNRFRYASFPGAANKSKMGRSYACETGACSGLYECAASWSNKASVKNAVALRPSSALQEETWAQIRTRGLTARSSSYAPVSHESDVTIRAFVHVDRAPAIPQGQLGRSASYQSRHCDHLCSSLTLLPVSRPIEQRLFAKTPGFFSTKM